MRVAMTGSSGLIGTALTAALTADGHEVTRLVRRPPTRADEAFWRPEQGAVDRDALRRADAVVHLAGEPIASGPWTAQRKQRIRDSRVQGTRVVAEALADLGGEPRRLVCASGINYYGDRGDEVLDEDSAKGSSFLADVVDDWESAADPAREAGQWVVHLRTGVSLVPKGGLGLLQVTRPQFKLGLGGKLGKGSQWISWVTLADVVGLYRHALETDELVGVVNAVAPNPVTNATYTDTLARVLGRPAFVHVPAAIPKTVAGELARELLFHSMRVRPARALSGSYEFRHQELEPTLRELLGKIR